MINFFINCDLRNNKNKQRHRFIGFGFPMNILHSKKFTFIQYIRSLYQKRFIGNNKYSNL